jgi:hypothetical protein
MTKPLHERDRVMAAIQIARIRVRDRVPQKVLSVIDERIDINVLKEALTILDERCDELEAEVCKWQSLAPKPTSATALPFRYRGRDDEGVEL